MSSRTGMETAAAGWAKCLVWAGTVALAVALALPAPAEIRVTAKLNPTQVAPGQSAHLTVTVSGMRVESLTLPSVAGLDFVHLGQSTQVQILNGAMSASVTHTYQVTPHRTGKFTIPPVRAGTGPDSGQSEPIELVVVPGAPGPAAGGPGQTQRTVPGAPNPSPLGQNGASTNAAAGLLRVVAPRTEFFVGEMAPVEIRAYFPVGQRVSLNGAPFLTNETFTLTHLSAQPAQGNEMLDSRPYTVLTWRAGISAVKPGEAALDAKLPVTVMVRDQRPRPRRGFGDPFAGGSLFDDPFFDDFFDRGIPQNLDLASDPLPVTVRPLPEQDRPPTFSGAVGQFDTSMQASPLTVAAGDPVTVHLQVTGTGNFDRVTTGGVEENQQWKTYQPTAQFEGGDSAGYRGTKTFEQAIVPRASGRLQIPSWEFSYFDPAARRYVIRATAPVTVEVTPASTAALAATSAVPAVPEPAAPPEPGPESTLVPSKVDPGGFVGTLRPLFLSPVFLTAQALPPGLLAVLLFLLWLRSKRSRDLRRLRAAEANRLVEACWAMMEKAARNADALQFFEAARGALQQRLGERWQLQPEAITQAEICARLGDGAGRVRTVFEKADEVIYSGQRLAPGDFAEWQAMVRSILQELEARK